MLQCACRAPVPNVGCSHHSFSPETTFQSSMVQHAPCHLHQRPVHPFSCPILLRCIGSAELLPDAHLLAELLEFCADIFSTIVRLKSFHLVSSVGSCPGFKLLEFRKNFTFLLEEVWEDCPGVVINEGDKISGSSPVLEWKGGAVPTC